MLSVWTATPELALEPDEAKKIESALKRFTKNYPIPISAKQMDMVFLCMVLAEVYGTRAIAIYSRRKMEAQQTPQPMPDNLFPFNAAG